MHECRLLFPVHTNVSKTSRFIRLYNYFTNSDISCCVVEMEIFIHAVFFFCSLINPNILFNDIHRLAIQAKRNGASSTIYACTDIFAILAISIYFRVHEYFPYE